MYSLPDVRNDVAHSSIKVAQSGAVKVWLYASTIAAVAIQHSWCMMVAWTFRVQVLPIHLHMIIIQIHHENSSNKQESCKSTFV
jgi:hypothetical protein